MKRILLPETGIELKVPNNVHYHDDGLVQNIQEHTAKLEERYSIYLGNSSEWNFEGLCFNAFPGFDSVEDALFDGEGRINFHTYVLRGLDRTNTSFLRGHEEAHVILKLKKMGELKKALEEKCIRSEELEDLHIESICQTGGVLAILRNHPSEEYLVTFPEDPNYNQWFNWINERSPWSFKKAN
jgi:hypothetical protein